MIPADPSPVVDPRSRSRTIAWGTLAALATGLAVAALARALVRREPLPVYGDLPAFSLVDSNGRPLTAGDLRGRTWVADFMFTSCAGACPAMTARMARLQRQVPADVWLVSFTVDPDHDTPEVLARYARQAGAGARWLFVTGPREALYSLAIRGFKLAVEAVPSDRQTQGDGPFLHSSHFVLVDGQGRVRGYYDSKDEQAISSLLRDLRTLPAEGV